MIHREGYQIILVATFIFAALNGVLYYFVKTHFTFYISLLISIILYALILNFFRNPARNTIQNDDSIIAAADGKIVIIEDVYEPEYFKDKRKLVSIFMSPLNVHVNRYPISGKVKYVKYHPGKYLVAFHPKSSTLNERTTVVVENKKHNKEILFRQIAGFVARRIVCYSKLDDNAVQGQDYGFIKFGSRIDFYLPLDAKINVELNQIVRGGETVIASF